MDISLLLCENEAVPAIARTSLTSEKIGSPTPCASVPSAQMPQTPQPPPTNKELPHALRLTHPAQTLSQREDSDSGFVSIAVFLNSLQDLEAQKSLLIPRAQLNLESVSQQIFTQMFIARECQIVYMLVSPVSRKFVMSEISEEDAVANIFSEQTAFLVCRTTIIPKATAPLSVPLRVGRRLANADPVEIQSASPKQSCEDELRDELTALLTNQTKRISLTIIAKMTRHSRSSLSLWRRGTYKGNKAVVSRSVAQALEVLRANDFVYVPDLHDSCVTRRK